MQNIETIKTYLKSTGIYEDIDRVTINTYWDFYDTNDVIPIKLFKNFDALNNYYWFHTKAYWEFYMWDFDKAEMKDKYEHKNEDLQELLDLDYNINDLNKFVLEIIQDNKIKCKIE